MADPACWWLRNKKQRRGKTIIILGFVPPSKLKALNWMRTEKLILSAVKYGEVSFKLQITEHQIFAQSSRVFYGLFLRIRNDMGKK